MRCNALFLAVLFGSATATASERELPLPDHGVHRDPYTHVEGYTTGAIEGMRRLAVDPATALQALKPAEPAEGAPAKLVIENPTSAWAFLDVAGTRIGQIGPFRTATLHGVAPGKYNVTFELPNRRVITETHATR